MKQVEVNNQSFKKVRDFLITSLKEDNFHRNWLIDRWNFCRYFAQVIHNTYNKWLDSLGIWTDRNKIAAVVNSEGEDNGEAFIQLGNMDFSDEFLVELISFAESKLSKRVEDGRFIQIRVNDSFNQLKNILRERGYYKQNWSEPASSRFINERAEVLLPDGFRVADANSVDDKNKGEAHRAAFSHSENGEKAYRMLRKAPDYNPSLDLSIITDDNRVASFATIWFDKINKIGILEPVGTIPEFRRLGLGRAVIYEGINRVLEMGGKKIYVGSDQDFYKALGFKVEYKSEIWEKDWDI